MVLQNINKFLIRCLRKKAKFFWDLEALFCQDYSVIYNVPSALTDISIK